HDVYVMPADIPVDVWPGVLERVERTIEIPAGGKLEVDVVDSKGKPAANVEVRLGVGLPRWPSRTTDAEGIVRFAGIQPGADAIVVARAPDGTVGWGTGRADADMVPRVPLV